MSYASQQDLIDRYGEAQLIQLTDRADPPAGAIDPDEVARALSFAAALIESLVSARYTVPLSPVPPMVVEVACDLARYRLYGEAPTDEVRRRYDDALRWLHDVQAARADLGGAAQNAPASGGVQYSAADRVFNTDSLSDY